MPPRSLNKYISIVRPARQHTARMVLKTHNSKMNSLQVMVIFYNLTSFQLLIEIAITNRTLSFIQTVYI